MKLLADWLPLVAFFVLYKTVDIYAATAGAIVISLLCWDAVALRV